MKKILFILIASLMLLLCACNNNLINMTSSDNGESTSIIWEDRIYKPFCVVSKNDCGKKIGYLNNEKDNVISIYKDLSQEEWIANYLTVDGGAMLYKEINVTDIPDGMQSEYD